MARQLVLTDNGTIELKEARANGLHGATIITPASLAASYSLTLFTALPAGTEYVQLSATGQLATVPGSPTSLDGAYDSGGPGAGRIITTDSGPVEAAGAGGFLASHSAPVYGLETTGAEYNFRLAAGLTANILEIQRGDQDGDISDDTFDALFALDGANRRLGINTVAPATLAHLLSPSGDAKLTVQAPAASDASVIFNENSTARWEVGYDDSAGGLVVGRLSFADPVLYISDLAGDAGGDIGINIAGVGALDGMVHLFNDTTNRRALFVQTAAGNDRTGIRVEHSGTGFGLLVDHLGDAIALQAQNVNTSTFACVVFRQRANVTGFNFVKEGTGAGTACNVQNDGTGACLLLDQNGDGLGLRIDSEATSAPLVTLLPIDGNARGDITADGSTRLADPSAPANGDFWFNPASQRWKVRISGISRTFANKLGPAFGPEVIATIATGVANADSSDAGILVLAAEGAGTTDDLDSLAVTGSGEVAAGDTLILRADAGDTITVKHNTGNIHLDGSADKALVNGNQLTLIWNGSDWEQLTPMMVLP